MAPGRNLAALLLLALCLAAIAGESVFIGRVDHITLLPHGHPRCPEPCPSGPQPLERICVSNSCGCAETAVRAERSVIGQVPKKLVILSDTVGEWCHPRIPLNADQILVRIPSSGPFQWSELSDDKELEAESFTTIGPVKVSELPAVEGEVKLADLLHALER